MADKYDENIERLMNSDEPLEEAWWNHTDNPLFAPLTGPNGERINAVGYNCGCVTQIKNGSFVAYSRAFTDAIRADPRIPSYRWDLRRDREQLELFATIQRAYDRDVRGVT